MSSIQKAELSYYVLASLISGFVILFWAIKIIFCFTLKYKERKFKKMCVDVYKKDWFPIGIPNIDNDFFIDEIDSFSKLLSKIFNLNKEIKNLRFFLKHLVKNKPIEWYKEHGYLLHIIEIDSTNKCVQLSIYKNKKFLNFWIFLETFKKCKSSVEFLALHGEEINQEELNNINRFLKFVFGY